MGKIIALSLLVCVLNILLRQHKPEYAFLVTLTASCTLLLFSLPYIREIWDKANLFAEKAGISGEYVMIAVKITGISLVTQAAVEICRDAGEGALAANVEMTGKILMLMAALPAVGAMFDAIERIL